MQFDKKNIQHDILTENIEYVKVTPMQTIIKVKANLNGLKKNSLTVGWFNWDDLDLIGDISFNVYNENGESIGNSIIESKRFFWYENGDFEEWEPHQLVPNNEDRSSIGGDLQMFEYIIISNSDYKSTLKIFPMITKGTEDDRRIFVEIGDFFELKFD